MHGESRVIVLNGGSSSGKSSLARALQEVLPEPWLRLGVDDLIDAMPTNSYGHTRTHVRIDVINVKGWVYDAYLSNGGSTVPC